MPASELIERVAALLSDAALAVDDQTRDELEGLVTRLREPARIAIVGRVKAGKSTLVNALLGQRVAPTDVSECTRVVTWFRYGHPERLVIRLDDDTMIETQLAADGRLPDELGVPVEKVASLHAYLANETLRWMTLIDTPGIGSVHRGRSAATEELLAEARASSRAASAADAIVFVFNQSLLDDEKRALEAFRGAEGEQAGTAANALGVLSRADQLGDGIADPWHLALELADRFAGVFQREVAGVVPVLGLVAETAEAASLTEFDAKNLAALATLDPKILERLLWSADRFVSGEAPLPSEARERLLALLDLYGIGRAVEFVRAGVTGAGALRRELALLSGIAEVKRTMATLFKEQDHVLKVRSALAILDKLTFVVQQRPSDPALARLRAGLEALRLDPLLQPVSELEVWHDCCTGRVSLPDDRLDDMRRLFTPGPLAGRLGAPSDAPDVLREHAQRAMARWRSFMVAESSPAQARVARVVLRSYQIAWQAIP